MLARKRLYALGSAVVMAAAAANPGNRSSIEGAVR
jgi:hypothetical protein